MSSNILEVNTPPTVKNEHLHLNGLNGIRAIAAVGVMLGHITIAFYWPETLSGKNKPLYVELWVSIFFALSGFLITYLLMIEKERGINIRKFYLRRILRIWPLYYLVLALTLVVICAYGLYFNFSSLIFTIFFAANVPFITKTPLPELSHYWSLGVEEQFYLFWPLMVKKLKGLKSYVILIIIVMVLAETLARYFAPGQYASTLYRALHYCRFQCMLIGALGAIYYYEKNHFFITIVTNKFVQVFGWFCIVLLVFNQFSFAFFLDNTLIAIVSVVLIMGQVTKKGLINLETKLFNFIGKISFGIYIIHALVLFFTSRYIWPIPMNGVLKFIAVYSIVIGVTIVLSYISYEFFEKRFLKFKKRFEVVKTNPG